MLAGNHTSLFESGWRGNVALLPQRFLLSPPTEDKRWTGNYHIAVTRLLGDSLIFITIDNISARLALCHQDVAWSSSQKLVMLYGVRACRNESGVLSSDLIRQAIACTRWRYGEPPELGMITFVDTSKVRKKRDFGRCYRRAGFAHIGYTQGGLMAFQLKPDEMPEPAPPLGAQLALMEV